MHTQTDSSLRLGHALGISGSLELWAKIIVYIHESTITDNRIMPYKVNNNLQPGY